MKIYKFILFITMMLTFVFSSTVMSIVKDFSISSIDQVSRDQEIIQSYFKNFSKLKSSEKFLEIIDIGKEAIEASQRLYLLLEEAKIHTQLSSSYFYIGNYEKVYDHAEKCSQIATLINDDKLLIIVSYIL